MLKRCIFIVYLVFYCLTKASQMEDETPHPPLMKHLAIRWDGLAILNGVPASVGLSYTMTYSQRRQPTCALSRYHSLVPTSVSEGAPDRIGMGFASTNQARKPEVLAHPVAGNLCSGAYTAL